MSLLPFIFRQFYQFGWFQLLLICTWAAEGRTRSPFLPHRQLATLVQPHWGRRASCDPVSSYLLFLKECCAGKYAQSVLCGYICLSQLEKGQGMASDSGLWTSMLTGGSFSALILLFDRLLFSWQCPGTAYSRASLRTCSYEAACLGLLFLGKHRESLSMWTCAVLCYSTRRSPDCFIQ